LTGHRDTHFEFLKRLKPNDEIVLETAEGTTQHYVVEETGIIDADNTSIRLDDEQDRLVLVTCYPFGAIVPGGPLRYVVTAVEVAVEGSRATVETSS